MEIMDGQIACPELITLIKDIFPQNAEFAVAEYDTRGCKCRISWKLNDPDKPHRRSKRIIIQITSEALDDYKASNLKNQQKAKDRFIKLIKNKYEKFNPDYNELTDSSPTEEWLIVTNLING